MRVIAVAVVATRAACSSPPPQPPPGKPHLEMHDVQDMVYCTSSMGRCEIPDHPEGCGPFERGAKGAVGDALWDEEKGWTLVLQNGLLIVRADDATQRSVRSYLDSERAKIKPAK